jgi:transposase
MRLDCLGSDNQLAGDPFVGQPMAHQQYDRSFPLVDALQAAGYRVHLANTAAIKRYEGLKHSGDEDDAAYLAHLLRLGILPSGYICPPAARAVRDLARKRMQLVRSRTAQVLSVENMLSRQTGAGMRSRAVQRLTAQAVEGFGFNPEVEQAMCANVAVIKTLNREIDKLEQRLHQCVRLRPEFRLLTSVPGIGQTLATLIMLEVGTIERFAAVGNFASYARCVDSARISNGKEERAGQRQARYQCSSGVAQPPGHMRGQHSA